MFIVVGEISLNRFAVKNKCQKFFFSKYSMSKNYLTRTFKVEMEKPEKMKILFICLGNTCRSPMAESIMRQKTSENQLDWILDSASLRPWNVGLRPEERCLKVLAENGLSTEHLCRMITQDDFYKFDYILAMDDASLQELRELAANAAETKRNKPIAIMQLLGSYIGRLEDEIIRDPYFTNDINAFRHIFVQISESCSNFIKLRAK